MHTIVHSISNFYISVLSWIEYLSVIAVLLIKAPFDNAGPHCTLIYLLSFIIYAAVIFSPFLLTNKIVIIEDITLSREAVFKWHLKSPFAETGSNHGPEDYFSKGFVDVHILVFVSGWEVLQAHFLLYVHMYVWLFVQDWLQIVED